MRISFRQGIVQYQNPGFLAVGFPYVDLVVVDTPTIVAFADETTDYLYIEQETVPNAWGPIFLATDQWLYWDINRSTGVRTFGITLLEPVAQPTPPIAPANDQHWFDTSVNSMKVFNGTYWYTRLRVFACQLSNGTVPISVSINSPTSFDGTQAGIVGEFYVGQILFDATTGLPLKTSDGFFITTENQLVVKTISTSDIKFASLVVSAVADQVLASYTIVKFVAFGHIEHADAFTATQPGQFGIIQNGVVVGEFVNVVVEGAISNPAWSWPTVNEYLYSDSTGVLTTTPPVPQAIPVATVVDVSTIVLGSPKSFVSITNITNPATPLADEVTQGTVRLNIPATVVTDPVAVGDNDPRLSDDRFPLAHTHPQSDITDLTTDLDARVLVAGDTMTGDLVLFAGAPATAASATPKSYVDTLFSTASTYFALIIHTHAIADVVGLQTALDGLVEVAGDTMLGFLTLNADPVLPLHAATKQYVDAASAVAIPLNEIVFGTGPAITSASEFTYDLLTGALDVNSTLAVASPGSVTIKGADGSALVPGGSVAISSGTSAGNDAGSIAITGADTSGFLGTLPGDVIIQTGTSALGSATDGGRLTLRMGAGDGQPDGHIDLFTDGSTAPEFRWHEATNTDYIGLKAPAGASSVTFELPAFDGSPGQAVVTDGSLALGWSTLPAVLELYTENPSTPTSPVATGTNAIGLGDEAIATLRGELAFANGSITAAGDAQSRMFVLHGSTADAVATELFLDGVSERMVLEANSTWLFNIRVVAREDADPADRLGAKYEGVIDRDGSGNTAFADLIAGTIFAQDNLAWSVAVAADDTNEALTVTVTGAAATIIYWTCYVQITHVRTP
ncbi:hypothetical protein E4H12_05935 [Candidatus Thorarchaeota archaeon]|nr:MAG: hypothetical protein E4H12_05935 [Candidatus Thorarchaeota archaeon]